MRLGRSIFILLFVIGVWAVWLLSAGWQAALNNLIAHYEISVTMIFGSFVAGISSLGGGTVAFPVFTKVLHIPAFDAKVFSLMIQSVGMGSATLFIIMKRIRVEWRIIVLGSLTGILGIFIGSYLLSPVVSSLAIKILFTMMLTSFGLTLIMLNARRERRHEKVPVWSTRERTVVLAAGFVGGILSGLHGSGIDIAMFSVMVLLFRMDEKIATPTSVIIMAFNAIIGALLHNFVFLDTAPIVIEYWLAAVPIVVIGAPIGAMVCNLMRSESINLFLLALIGLEFISTLFFVPMDAIGIEVGVFSLLLFSGINFIMLRAKAYKRV